MRYLNASPIVAVGCVVALTNAGPAGGIGGKMNCPTRPDVFIVPSSRVMNSDTGLPFTSRKLIANV